PKEPRRRGEGAVRGSRARGGAGGLPDHPPLPVPRLGQGTPQRRSGFSRMLHRGRGVQPLGKMRRNALGIVIGGVVVFVIAVVGVVAWAAGHYTTKTVTVGTATSPVSAQAASPTVAACARAS